MRPVLTLLLIAFADFLLAQNTKGVTPASTPEEASGTTRAVIIGISDYKEILDLNYADKDAMAFYNYLVSKAGGSIDSARIQMLLNEEATEGKIWAAIKWIASESRPGDKAIIYFSGHGDVETVIQKGFLLAYDTYKNNYVGNAIGFYYLTDYINALAEKNVQVQFIADACHSGNLAGGKEGARIASEKLNARWASEVKILSCQPGELSQEGEQWGGGRGVFTYHLIRGLTGLADESLDSRVTLAEIERHLKSKVPSETQDKQYPVVVGIQQTLIATVDEASFLALQKEQSGGQLIVTGYQNRMADQMVATLDTACQSKYRLFEKYLNSGNALSSRGLDDAYGLYLSLFNQQADEQLLKLMRRNLAAILQDEAQEVINNYLAATLDVPNHEERDYFLKAAEKLQKTIELEEPASPNLNSLKAKKLFLEGRAFIRSQDDKEIQDAIIKLYQSLAFEPEAAYCYNTLGTIHYLKYYDYQKALEFFTKALELAPTWGFAFDNLSACYIELKEYDKAIALNQKAIERNPDFPDYYFNRGNIYYDLQQYDKAVADLEKAISLNPLHPDPYQTAMASYNELKKFDKVIPYGKKILELDPQYPYRKETYYELTRAYSMQNNKTKAIESFALSLENGFDDFAFIQQDQYLDNIRSLPEFKDLMRKYFPNDYKE